MRALILKRLQEPSTWAGLGLVGAAFGVPVEVVALVGKVVMGLAGLAAVALPEGRAE